ncbi:MAG: TIGR02302 family protein [Rhodobacter sp.]|nr:TIGR02302 family protein [Rhodobacter sp.]
MSVNLPPSENALNRLRWPLRLTFWGLWAERVTRAFWPVWSVLLLVAAALMLGLHDLLPLEAVWGGAVLSILALLAALVRGVRHFRAPTRAEALDRVDRTLPGRPITALADTQAIGAGDGASQMVWKAHVARMAERVAAARAVEPDLRVSARDPFALRYVAVLAFAMALLFGSVLRVASVAEMAPGTTGEALATGPSWEGWIEPPAYTGKPSLYLNDIRQAAFAVPEASRLTVRLYGEVGALTVAETVSGRIGEVPSAADVTQSFEILQSGTLSIEGPGGASWEIEVIPDEPPAIEALDDAERGLAGEMRQPFRATDDYGVVAGRAELQLDLASVDRRHGLTLEPEPRETIVLDLPITFSGDRTAFDETLIENLSQHPWATLPVRLALFAEDALGQEGAGDPVQITLPGRRFFDPLAGAIVEQRRDLLWNRENGARAAQVLRAISHRPDDVFRSETAYLKLRVALRRLELFAEYGITDAQQEEIAQVLWDIAVLIEDGNLADARERLRQARERLQEAMRNGATDEEIAELMQELREAMQDYMRQLAEQQQQDGQQQAQNQQNMQEITGDQLQQLMDRLQELMEQGRMDEAQELLDRLAEMMENMQVTQGQQGQSPGQQAMEGLADTLRQQQGLSDETFGDLQEQFNQDGQQPGQQGQQPGQQQGQQQGQQPGQLPGQGQQGEQGQGQEFGQGQGQNGMQQPGQGNQPGLSEESLANRQRALRNELNRQTQNLPGAGTPEGDAARDALGRAGEAMDDAEDALRENDLAGALDNQAEAIEALRDGMRNLGEAMAQQQQQQGQQGDAQGQARANRPRDPLGREAGNDGQIGTDEQLLQGDDVYRRARELLDEIRRRSSEQSRPEEELDYLKRLLDRF